MGGCWRCRPPARLESAKRDILRSSSSSGTLRGVEEQQGIDRGEVRSIMIALADITVDVKTILGYIEGDDSEEEAEDLPDP